MGQRPDAIPQHLTARVCWQVARRDDTRLARRLSRKPLGDGGYRRDAGALLDAFWPFLQAIGVMPRLEGAHGAAMHRTRLPVVPASLLSGVKPLLGMERRPALPSTRCREEAIMPLVGCPAQPVRQGSCPRGATKRQGERPPGPLCPDTLAQNIVPWHVRDLEAVCHGAMRALATAGGVGAQGTGMAEGPDLEATERAAGGGQVPRPGRLAETRGRVHEGAVTGYGWPVLRVLAAATTRPLAVNGGQLQAPEGRWARALVSHARMPLAGYARRHQGGFDPGFWEGPTRWWRARHAIPGVGPATGNLAGTVDARAQALAGAGSPVGRRVHTVRQGQGQAAGTERLATAGVGLRGLSTDAREGTPEQARQATRRDFPAHPLNAVVGRQWQGKDDGPGGTPVWLTQAPVAQPVQVFAADDDRRRLATCCRKAAKPQWELGPPPPPHARAVRGHGVFTLRMCALATASRLPCAREARGGEPVGWQRGRRQLLEQTRAKGLVWAQGHYGSVHRAEDSLLVGVKRKEVPPAIGSRPQVLAKDELPARGSQLCWNFSSQPLIISSP
jgi:hypothetical protein